MVVPNQRSNTKYHPNTFVGNRNVDKSRCTYSSNCVKELPRIHAALMSEKISRNIGTENVRRTIVENEKLKHNK